MIVVLLGWLVLANFLPSLPSRGLQKYPLLIIRAQGKLCCTERSDIFGFDFKIKVFQLFKHQFNMVQHFVYTSSKYTNVV